MAIGQKIHRTGAAFIFISAVLLLVVSLTAPESNSNAIFKVNLKQSNSARNASIHFGSLGYCIHDLAVGSDFLDNCTNNAIGYSPMEAIESTLHSPMSDAARSASAPLTKVLVLHPIACVVAFVASLLCCRSGFRNSLLGFVVSCIAFMLTVLVMAIDVHLFQTVRDAINEQSEGGVSVDMTGIGLTAAAGLFLLFGGVLVLFTCCAGRRKKHSVGGFKKHEKRRGRSGK